MRKGPESVNRCEVCRVAVSIQKAHRNCNGKLIMANRMTMPFTKNEEEQYRQFQRKTDYRGFLCGPGKKRRGLLGTFQGQDFRASGLLLDDYHCWIKGLYYFYHFSALQADEVRRKKEIAISRMEKRERIPRDGEYTRKTGETKITASLALSSTATNSSSQNQQSITDNYTPTPIKFITTCEISAFHHKRCEFEPCSSLVLIINTTYIFFFRFDEEKISQSNTDIKQSNPLIKHQKKAKTQIVHNYIMGIQIFIMDEQHILEERRVLILIF